VALAYGVPARTLRNLGEVEPALSWLGAQPRKPALLQVMVDPMVNVHPKIAFGSPIGEMEPPLSGAD
jgi:thiamine pyrophosphate-dependent acetolactate synthase large subunit-like protein